MSSKNYTKLKPIATDREALVIAARAFKNASPVKGSDFGSEVTIEPGRMWGDYMVVTGGYNGGALYLYKNGLYTQPTNSFIRSIYLNAITDGAKKAEWIIPIAKAQMDICMSLAAGPLGLIGKGASLAVSLAKTVAFYKQNKANYDAAAQLLKKILQDFMFVKRNCPFAYDLLITLPKKKLFYKAADSVLNDLNSIEAQDYINLISSLIKELIEEKRKTFLNLLVSGLKSTLIQFAKILANKKITSGEIDKISKNHAKKLQQEGLDADDALIRKFFANPCSRNKDTLSALTRIQENCEKAIPYIDALARAAVSF